MNIPNDASISRTHATFMAHADAGGVTVCDTSKFGVRVDEVRLDPKAGDMTGEVVLRGAAAALTCVVALGCAKPAAYEAKLVYTPSDARPGSGDDDDDATTDGDETDAEDRTVEGGPKPKNAENENENENETETETRRAAPRPAPVPRGADAAEGKATTVFGALPERARRAADASASAQNPGQSPAEAVSNAVVDFKRFKKQRLGPPGAASHRPTVRGGGAAAARRAIVRYADEAYDALPQWEDATVAAAHAAERADARRAEEMFEAGAGGTGAAARNGAAQKPAPRRRGAAARAR